MPALTFKNCVICEDARFELRKVLTLVGVFGVPPDAGVTLKDVGKPVRLCFAFYGPPPLVSGTYRVRAELRGPRGRLEVKPTPEELHTPMDKDKGIAVAVFWFIATFGEANEYTVALSVDGEEDYVGKFKISS